MRVVLEIADLANCSPAVVSRCSIVYMEDSEELLPSKSEINKWFRTLPEVLMCEVDRLDSTVNYFMIHMRENFADPSFKLH
jgi:hypothetical protein